MKAELLGKIMDKAFTKNVRVSCKREFSGSAKGFTFRSKDGAYPGCGGKIQWMSSIDECLEMAGLAEAQTLVAISHDNKILDEIELIYN